MTESMDVNENMSETQTQNPMISRKDSRLVLNRH